MQEVLPDVFVVLAASWETNQFVGTIGASGGVLNINVDTVGAQPWYMQLGHRVWFVGGQQYTLCYDARSTSGSRAMTACTDVGAPIYTNSSGGQETVTLDTTWRQFSHTFTIAENGYVRPRGV